MQLTGSSKRVLVFSDFSRVGCMRWGALSFWRLWSQNRFITPCKTCVQMSSWREFNFITTELWNEVAVFTNGCNYLGAYLINNLFTQLKEPVCTKNAHTALGEEHTSEMCSQLDVGCTLLSALCKPAPQAPKGEQWDRHVVWPGQPQRMPAAADEEMGKWPSQTAPWACTLALRPLRFLMVLFSVASSKFCLFYCLSTVETVDVIVHNKNALEQFIWTYCKIHSLWQILEHSK